MAPVKEPRLKPPKVVSESAKEYFLHAEKIGVEINDKSKTISKAIEVRNISVHNRCFINSKYLSKTGEAQDLIGKPFKVTGHIISEVMTALHKSVIATDAQVRRKFKIKGYQTAKLKF